METSELFAIASEQILLFGASAMRLSVAFLMLPLFANQLIPPLIRNALFLALSLMAFVLQPTLDISALQGHEWGVLFLKEAFVGVTIGFFFGIFVWAFEAAGEIIDTMIGASAAMLFDPLSGHQVTPIGEFIGRWINYVFLAAGGLLFLTTAVLESYVIWPLTENLPNLRMASVVLFEREISTFMRLMLTLISPILVIIMIIDISLGMLNRFSQRLNVFFISISIKGLAAVFVLALLIPILIGVLERELNAHRNSIDGMLNEVLQMPER
ncbi:MAG: EscT/YscT/HrcT family type III secretion system export apparatus protein [Gammaproteobacteria bacterium]|nr:MAG: EscT/YscT/HrcT family type III secretion system export apparatus protein [Gammaproteobacteria bacterium]